jgi:glycosyltransferase involved in cell wall biosynthesis
MISIIIPAHNEEKRLPKTLENLAVFVQNRPGIKEVIVVDDGSTDGTVAEFTTFLKTRSAADVTCIFRIISIPKNIGKGKAVCEGLLASRGDRALFTDADLSTPLGTLDIFLSFSEDIVIGSRKVSGSNITLRQPFGRRVVSRWGGMFRKLFLLHDIEDTQCGFKLLSRRAVQAVIPKIKVTGYAFDIELLTIARDNHFSIKEVGVVWNHDDNGNFKIWSATLHILKDMIAIFLRHAFHQYIREE